VFQFLPALEAAGLTYQVHLPPAVSGSGLRRLMTSLHERREIGDLAEAAQVVFVQKRLLPTSQVFMLARHNSLLFDFDDAIFTSPTGDRSWLTQRRVETRLKHVLAAARVVIAGNRHLCDYARQFAREVIHLPTVLDSSRYPAKIHIQATEIVVGWIGHSVNHPYLLGLAEVLRQLAARVQMRLLVVSDRDLKIPGVLVENRRWSESTEIADILRMDIGIMPMPDDPWSRGKCGFKAIQYMAAGIPVVCSAVGANIDIVRDGIDGYCVSSQRQWNEGMTTLCSSADLRQRMGAAARERVCTNYSLEHTVPMMLGILSRFHESG